ncbi:hypothetical protein LOD99_7506 [Oopsacas minuta]|uniref:Uncharacterized protein n=1 Tax=Oopsacas minuta TaxID=111878 RepID=A0AAV7JUJ4_9METZ|nr:hypothetical protein LOD99_7506 [Oopsacas minuta]
MLLNCDHLLMRLFLERKKIALKKCAVPSIFPNCPSYLTDPTVSYQILYLDDKKESRIQEAYQRRLADFKETEAKFTIIQRSRSSSSLGNCTTFVYGSHL